MAQKSLPILNKVNTSMIWYSTFYFKNYKWLSSQYLYFLYFLNKIFIFLDFFIGEFMWVKFYKKYLYSNAVYSSKLVYKKVRFFKPVTSYVINLNSKLLVFNLYYKTTLQQFQEFNMVKVVNYKSIEKIYLEETLLKNIYFK